MTVMSENPPAADVSAPPRENPFRRATLRGLAVLLPPLLTVVILVWVWHIVQDYVFVPLETGLTTSIRWSIDDTLKTQPSDAQMLPGAGDDGRKRLIHQGEIYVGLANGHWVPQKVYAAVAENPGQEMPQTSQAIYDRYVQLRYLKRHVVIPVMVCLFVLLLYLLGKFIAAGIGRYLWSSFESRILSQLPVVRHVYSSVKQVTDFVFSEQDLQYTRVVAVEYPRKGAWSLGFVTGESMLDIRSAANEPVLSILMPTSPMPATGFTITVRKSETIDLNITLDQAFQFIFSCGVVVPPHQQWKSVDGHVAAAVQNRIAHVTAGRKDDPSSPASSPTPASHPMGEPGDNGRIDGRPVEQVD